ncbi:MAG: lamin tail domain-containing protein [Verrucomicrobiota bacterium]|nr:lamin tail domain-containing protein [Verrucomicrobiota bacterium]
MTLAQLLALGLSLVALPALRAELLISEIMPGTEHDHLDEEGKRNDWVELHNSGSEEISLEGHALTDDPENLLKWEFPAGSLKPGDYLTVFASGKDRKDPEALHTNFKLKSEGEYLALVLVKGRRILQEFSPAFPKVGKGQSCGYRFRGDRLLSDQFTVLARPTPDAKNDSPSVEPRVADTKFSIDRGFYREPFEVELSTATEGAEIRYTLDGSAPSSQRGLVYRKPVRIETTTVLRAMAWKKRHLPTNVDTASYLFPGHVVSQPARPEGWATHYEAKVNPFFARMIGADATDEKGVIVKYAMTPPEKLGVTAGEVEEALLALPSISIATDQEHLFDRKTGIHVKPEKRGREWERPVSVELIDPEDREKGFQVDAGIRIRGGHSRSPACQKHAYRLYFRKEYGAGELAYPLFGDEGVDRFDDIDLRTAQNYSYHYSGSTHHTLVRDVFSRDCQRDLGQPYTRSRYYHLYLNGLYWGLYQTQEHAESSYAARYFGGKDEDYDVLKARPSEDGRATDGTDKGWRELWELANAMAAEDLPEERLRLCRALQGLNAEGLVDEDLPGYLDVDNLIDYMLVIFVTGNFDAPVTQFAGNFATNNWFSIWRRNGRDGFQFFCHDSEHTLAAQPETIQINRVGPFLAGSSYDQFNPQWLHQQLTTVGWYRDRFRARAEKVLGSGGALSREANLTRMHHRAQEVGRAILAECARWGDRQKQEVRTRDDWEDAIAWLEEVIEERAELIPGQLAEARHFPRGVPTRELAEAPLFNPVQAPRFREREKGGTFSAGEGLIYFRTDGLDPMDGGEVRAGSHKAVSDRVVSRELVPVGSAVRIHIPGDGSLGTKWVEPGFDDRAWRKGKGGIGYDRREDYLELIGVDVKEDLLGKGTSVLARYAFNLAEVPEADRLTLRLKVEDGFAAYLNGVEVARENLRGAPVWNGRALSRPDGEALRWLPVDLTEDMKLLREGKNVLAIWLINEWEGSSDLLLVPELSLSNEIPGTLIGTGAGVRLMARLFRDDQWSPLLEPADRSSGQAKPAARGQVMISEIMYHPAGPDGAAREAGLDRKSDFEFLELVNISGEAVDLGGVYCREGIYFFMSSSHLLDPGERVVIARNARGMAHRYPRCVVGETYLGNLGNGRETIAIRAADGKELAWVTYDDEAPWPTRADGGGHSLVRSAFSAEAKANDPRSWKSSEKEGGTPGKP